MVCIFTFCLSLFLFLFSRIHKSLPLYHHKHIYRLLIIFFFACFTTRLDGSLLLRIPLGHIFDLDDSSKMNPPAGSAQNPHASPTSKQQKQQKQQHLKRMLLPNGKPLNPFSSKKIYNSLSDINKEYIIHTFKEHATFTPARLVVNTRDHDAKYAFATAAASVAAVVVVVAEQGKSYRIFGIDGKVN